MAVVVILEDEDRLGDVSVRSSLREVLRRALRPTHEVVFRPTSDIGQLDQSQADRADVVVSLDNRASAAWVGRLPGLRLWQSFSVGTDGLPLSTLMEHAIPAARCLPESSGDALAEHALLLLLLLLKRGPTWETNLRPTSWGGQLGREVQGLQLAIVGAGASGQSLGVRAASLGCSVHLVSRSFEDGAAREKFHEWAASASPLSDLDAVLARCDAASVHLPLVVSTRHLIGAAQLAALPRGSFLVNVSRGEIVDEQALIRSLTSGHLAGAGLDVFATEPLPLDSELRSAPNVVLTPHVAGRTMETLERRAAFVRRNVDRVMSGQLADGLISVPDVQ